MQTEFGEWDTTYTARGLPRYQLEIRHRGLNRFQVIRGDDRYIVHQKAVALAAQWDEAWARVEEKASVEAHRQNKQEEAELRTAEAAEVQRSLRVLDGGVVVFDAVQGVEPQSETVWRQADRYAVPRICFVNKMDRVGASYERTIETIKDRLGANPIPMQVPIGFEATFRGVIDLLTMKAVLWEDDLGKEPKIVEIPEDLRVQAEEARRHMVEKIAELETRLKSIKSTPGFDQLMATAVGEAALYVLADGPDNTKLDYRPGEARDLRVHLRLFHRGRMRHLASTAGTHFDAGNAAADQGCNENGAVDLNPRELGSWFSQADRPHL